MALPDPLHRTGLHCWYFAGDCGAPGKPRGAHRTAPYVTDRSYQQSPERRNRMNGISPKS